MGCFAATCGLTNTPITENSPAVMVLLNPKKIYHYGRIRTWETFQSDIALRSLVGIYKGTYDDYGGLTEYQGVEDACIGGEPTPGMLKAYETEEIAKLRLPCRHLTQEQRDGMADNQLQYQYDDWHKPLIVHFHERVWNKCQETGGVKEILNWWEKKRIQQEDFHALHQKYLETGNTIEGAIENLESLFKYDYDFSLPYWQEWVAVVHVAAMARRDLLGSRLTWRQEWEGKAFQKMLWQETGNILGLRREKK